MDTKITIVLAEDDKGHATLIKNNIRRAGIHNEIIHFKDGEETLNFLFSRGPGPHREHSSDFFMLLDTQMPKVDGIEVLRQIKQDDHTQNIPIIMLTTTDDQEEMVQCHILGCSNYIKKPFDHNKFREVLEKSGIVKAQQ